MIYDSLSFTSLLSRAFKMRGPPPFLYQSGCLRQFLINYGNDDKKIPLPI